MLTVRSDIFIKYIDVRNSQDRDRFSTPKPLSLKPNVLFPVQLYIFWHRNRYSIHTYSNHRQYPQTCKDSLIRFDPFVK